VTKRELYCCLSSLFELTSDLLSCCCLYAGSAEESESDRIGDGRVWQKLDYMSFALLIQSG